jgi:hypothetical protein
MARSNIRSYARTFNSIEDHHAKHEGRELTIARLSQVLGFSSEQQLFDVAPTYL